MSARPLILAYHAVSGSWPARLAIEPYVLREQLGLLARLGYVGLTVSEAERRRRDGTLPERSVAVTFDDGYASTLRAEDILAEFGFPATIFVVTSFAESGNELLWPGMDTWIRTEHRHELEPASWEALGKLVDAGWEVGSHTVTHRLLTALPEEILDAELTRSREAIAARFGDCTSLAYPYGVSNRRVEAAALRAGYDVACTLSFSHERDAPYRRPRLELTTRDYGLRLSLQLSLVRSIRRSKVVPLIRKLRVGRHWLPLNAGEELEKDSVDFPDSASQTRLSMRTAPRPLVTVLMCVRDGERYVLRAINSALTQTWGDFELIVVDDASADRTPELLERISDPRVSVLHESEHQGAARARNIGLGHARGKYIAILDADDVALPRRLERQVAFLDQRPQTAIVGSQTVVIDADGVPRGFRSMPRSAPAVRWTAMLKAPFAHSSVMFRAELLGEGGLSYDRDFEPSEDYDLSVRVLTVGDGENMVSPLVFYRVHPDQLSNTRRDRQLRLHDAIVTRTIAAELPDFHCDHDQLSSLWQLFSGIPVEAAQRVALGHLYLDLFEHFRAKYEKNPEIEALTRSVIQSVLFRCFIPPPSDFGWSLIRRLIGLDAMALARFPVDASSLASRRTLWCRSPRIRRAAALAAFAPGDGQFASAVPVAAEPLRRVDEGRA